MREAVCEHTQAEQMIWKLSQQLGEVKGKKSYGYLPRPLKRQVDEIVVACRESDLLEISELCRTYGITKCSKVIRGGESRVHSVLLAAMEASPDAALLAVQDGARPLVTPGLIGRVISAALRCGAAAPAVAVKDTIKTVRDGGAVAATLDRDRLRELGDILTLSLIHI